MADEQPSTPLSELVGDDVHVQPLTPLPVYVVGAVMTEARATTLAGMTTVAGVAQSGKRLLTADPRRARAIIVGVTQALRIGSSGAQAEMTGVVWPSGVPLTLTTRDEVWASAATGTTDISVISENWS
jgi:hypothetical protein